MSGAAIDIQKIIYIAASMDDYNGDGISNTGDPCIFFSVSGIDADKDGVDDVCDQDIQATPQAAANSVTTSAQTAKDIDASGSSTRSTAARPGPFFAPPSSGTVLGDSTNSSNSTQSASPQQANMETTPATQLFRVNWLTVLLVGLGTSVAISSIYAYLAKR